MSATRPVTSESFQTAAFSYERWQKRFLTQLLRAASVVGLFAVIFSSIGERAELVTLYTIAYLGLLAITFLQRLPHNVRVLSVMLMVYALGVSTLFDSGIYSDVGLFFVVFVVLSVLLVGPRTGLGALILSITTFAIFAYFYLTGQVALLNTKVPVSQIDAWLAHIASNTLMAVTLLIALTYLQREFKAARQREERVLDTLIQERTSLAQTVEQRTAELRASADIGRTTSSILEADRLLQQAVTLIADRFNYYYVGVFTLEPTSRTAILQAGSSEAAQRLKSQNYQFEVGGASPIGYVTAQRRAWHTANASDDALYYRQPALPETQSEIVLPLLVGERLLGVLDIHSIHRSDFDEANAAVLRSLADQLAVALNNADQYQREQSRAQQTTELLNSALDLAGLTNREQLHSRVINLSMRLLKADGAELWLPTDNDELELAATNEASLTGRPGRRLKIGSGLAGRAFTTNAALRADDDQAATNSGEPLLDASVTAALAAPLYWRSKSIGVLSVTRSQPNRGFTQEDENVARLLAAQVSATLETARLMEEQQHTLKELDEVNRRLTGEAWAKYVKNFKTGFLRKAYVAPHSSRLILPEALPEIDLSMASRQPMTWSQPADRPAETAHATGLAAPIMLRGEILGALQVGENTSTHHWTADDVSFIQAVADQVALAIDNARLLEQTEQRAQREQFLAEVSRKMLAASDMRGIIQIAGDELSNALGVSRTEIQLGTEVGQSTITPQHSENGQPA